MPRVGGTDASAGRLAANVIGMEELRGLYPERAAAGGGMFYSTEAPAPFRHGWLSFSVLLKGSLSRRSGYALPGRSGERVETAAGSRQRRVSQLRAQGSPRNLLPVRRAMGS